MRELGAKNAKLYTIYSLNVNLRNGKKTSPIAIHPFFLQDYYLLVARYSSSTMILCGALYLPELTTDDVHNNFFDCHLGRLLMNYALTLSCKEGLQSRLFP